MVSLVFAILVGIFTSSVTVFFTIFFIPTLRTLNHVRRLPGPPDWPLLGLTLEIAQVSVGGLGNYLKYKVINGYKRVASTWLLGVPMVFVNSPEDVEVILSSVKHIEKGMEYFSLKQWLSEGLLLSRGTKWHTRRKMLTPTFHFKLLDDQCPTMYKKSLEFVKMLLDENGLPFDPIHKVSKCTLDVICETAMGVSIDGYDKSSSYVETIQRVTTAAAYRVMNLYLHRNWLWELTPIGRKNGKDVKFLHDITDNIVSDKKKTFHKTKVDNGNDAREDIGVKKRSAFLDTLLEFDLSPTDVREEVDTFLFEGHDTSASIVQFALFELGQNPEVQQLAYEEQQHIFNGEQREATLGDIQNMNYLDRFIKECLRLYPSVPYISRTLTEDLYLRDLPLVPKGANVVVTPFYLHRNADYYPDPEKFDPDRFLPENCHARHPYAYIPFSAGPRNCIGQKFAMMEVKMVMSSVIRFARIEAASSREELNIAPLMILRNLGTLKIRVLPRN